MGLGLSACTSVEERPERQAPVTPPAPTPAPAPTSAAAPILPAEPKLYVLPDEERRITRIVVDTTTQKARFYDGAEEIGWTTVATGVSSFPTPTGEFTVIEKVENKRSNLYGKVYGKGGKLVNSNARVGRDPVPEGGRFEGAHMPYFLRLTTDGIGLHAGPIPRPGRPASHGCIRVPSKVAPLMFEQIALGTPVSIEGDGPSYERYIARQRAATARRAAEQRRQDTLAKAAQTPPAASSEPALAASAQTQPQPETSATPPGAAISQPPQSTAPISGTEAPAEAASRQQSVPGSNPMLPALPTAQPSGDTIQSAAPQPPTPAPGAVSVPSPAPAVPVSPSPALVPAPAPVQPEKPMGPDAAPPASPQEPNPATAAPEPRSEAPVTSPEAPPSSPSAEASAR